MSADPLIPSRGRFATIMAPSNLPRTSLFLYEQLQLRLGESLKLYREVLRIHRRQLPSGTTRELADSFARAEFRSHMAAASEQAATVELHVPGAALMNGISSGPASSVKGSLPRADCTSERTHSTVQGCQAPRRPLDATKERLEGAEDPRLGPRGVSRQLQVGALGAAEQLRCFNEAWQEYLEFARNRKLRHGRHLRPAQRALMSEVQRQQLQAIKGKALEVKKQHSTSCYD